VFCEFNPPSPSAIEVLTLTTLAPQLHQHQLDLEGLLVQQGAELDLKPFCRSSRARSLEGRLFLTWRLILTKQLLVFR
jgi:hypothetical protein